MKLGVRAGPGDGARVKHFIAGVKKRDIRPHGMNYPRGIPAEHLPRAGVRLRTLSHLHVDRVDRDRFHFNEEVPLFRFRNRKLDVDERLVAINASWLLISDGSHT